MLDDITELLVDAIPPLMKDEPAGKAQVKQIFTVTQKGLGKVMIAGCMVTEGKLLAAHRFRVLRDGESAPIFVSKPGGATLQHHKDQVAEIKQGFECGIGIGFDDLQEGDVLECFQQIAVKQAL